MAEGEIVALIGPNGAGTTTLFNLINGLLRPSAGSIRMGGRLISAMPAYRIARLGLGRTFQTPRPFLDLTAAENVAAAARWSERPGGTPAELLALVEMGEQAAVPARRLTGGAASCSSWPWRRPCRRRGSCWPSCWPAPPPPRPPPP